MLVGLLAKFGRASSRGERPSHVSILLPFLIIAAGLGVLGWRSYQLSVRMAQGASSLATQYAGYASEITARRLDAAVRSELARANEEWQQIERMTGGPGFGALQQWIGNNDWIVSAIYVPDADPASSIYLSEVPTSGDAAPRLAREFYTSMGTVRYRYDPVRLLSRVRGVIRQQPLVRAPGSLAIQQQADVSVVANAKPGFKRLLDGFAFVTPLAAPLDLYSVRAVVRTSYVGSGWENQGVISLVVTIVAVALAGIGAFLTVRGMKKEADATNLRAALVANVSHELRTPLSMIRLGAETLKRATRLSEKERQEIQEQILREVLHLSHLVENVLDVARMQHRQTRALAFGPVMPRDVVVNLVSTYESWIRSRGFKVEMHIEDGIEEQMWDREAVARAVLNLIDNAMKYSDEQKDIVVELRQENDFVVIAVRDRGIGIDPRELSRIFNPYYRAQFSDTQTRRGAGLGLTLVQQIVESHGGSVEVESEPGVGSTFRLLFPSGRTATGEALPALVEVPDLS